MKRYLASLVVLFPLFALAEGQYIFGIYEDMVVFFKVSIVCVLLVFLFFVILKKVVKIKLKPIYKFIIWIGSSIVAIFIFTLIKNNSPFEKSLEDELSEAIDAQAELNNSITK